MWITYQMFDWIYPNKEIPYKQKNARPRARVFFHLRIMKDVLKRA